MSDRLELNKNLAQMLKGGVIMDVTTPEDLTPGTWAGYKRFTDDTGAAVYTYVRSYARFADDEVPVGRCTLTGILQYDATGEGRYILKLRDENDWTR